MQKPEEIDELKRLKERVRRLETALADAHVDLALERAFGEIACERAGIKDVAGFKKKWLGRRTPSCRPEPRPVGGGGVSSVEDEPTELLSAAAATRTAGGGRGAGAGVGAQGAAGAAAVGDAQALGQAWTAIGRDRLFQLLGANGLLVERLRAEYPVTTSSGHYLPVFPTRVKELKVTKPNEVWVGDLTYLRTLEGFLYLALLTDRGSRKIVGYHCGDTLEAEGCLAALEMALKGLPEGQQPIHHTDRGSQYCSHAYVGRLYLYF